MLESLIIPVDLLSPVLRFIGTIVGAVISGLVVAVVLQIQHDKTMALVEYRLGQLEEKVDQHNNLVERMYAVEARLDVKKSDL